MRAKVEENICNIYEEEWWREVADAVIGRVCFFFGSDGMADPSIFGKIERDYEQVSIPFPSITAFSSFPYNFQCCLSRKLGNFGVLPISVIG